MKRLTIILFTLIAAGGLQAADSQKTFASPDDAINALRDANQSGDKAALEKLFGPDAKLFLTGDKVQDANNEAHFATALTEGVQQVRDGDNKITIEVGTNHWPFAIPLVKTNDSQWVFDTAAGREEILNRHIGRDELNAIGVCNAYVEAQRQYASMNVDGSGTGKYAEKFRSSSGKKDGLYWKAAEGETPSPFSELVAEAHAEGYHHHHGWGPHPFHGYYFRILTRQGSDAPGGKMNYKEHGALTKGFALVAWPDKWDQSGVMTFIVNQDGKIYEQNFGEKTSGIAGSIKEYNPDSNWKPVQDQGIMEKE